MERADYERIVQETVTGLPEHLQEQLKDVIIVVEERQPRGRRGWLLGLFEGIPLTAWGRESNVVRLPEKISLYMESIEAVARTPEEIPHIVRETLLHEIAHFFGFEHDHIHKMERRWRKKRTSA